MNETKKEFEDIQLLLNVGAKGLGRPSARFLLRLVEEAVKIHVEILDCIPGHLADREGKRVASIDGVWIMLNERMRGK